MIFTQSFAKPKLSLFGTFSDLNDLLSTHAVKDGDETLLLAIFEDILDSVSDILQVLGGWEVDISLDLSGVIEELEGFFINIKKGVFLSGGDWGVNQVTSVVSALVDLNGKDIFTLQDDLGGSVLSWLSSGNISNFAWVSLNHNEGTWLESIGINLVGLRGTGISYFKIFVFRHVSISLYSLNIN